MQTLEGGRREKGDMKRGDADVRRREKRERRHEKGDADVIRREEGRRLKKGEIRHTVSYTTTPKN
jgi:hypothetical protein